MPPLSQITDVETLRQVALLQEQEIRAQQQRISELVRELSMLKGKDANAQLALELDALQEQMAAMQRRMFGTSSEKRPPEVASDVAALAEPEAPAPKRGHGPRQQARQLPLIERRHVLPTGAQQCPACAGALAEMGTESEDADEITVIERRFVLVRHQRQKYRCRCNGAVVTAPAPPRLIPGGRYSIDFAVDVAVAKYLDHMPLERQVRVMQREGLTIDSHTLWDQIEALATHLEPSYRALFDRVRSSETVHADETWWRLMDKKAATKWWAWCLATEDAVYHRILPSRSKDAARQLLDGYRGVVMCDGYTVYSSLERGGFSLAHCWAHVRRKFVEIETFYPAEAKQILDLIAQLYAVEKLIPPSTIDRDPIAAYEVRRRLRDQQSRLIVDQIREWAYAQRATRESGLRKAVDYMLGLWIGLVRFLDDPRVVLDNNRVERALRGPVLGRKNHFGSRSQRGTEVAALFYSLLETAKLCDIDEKTYLLTAAHKSVAEPGAVLLPHHLLEENHHGKREEPQEA